MNEIIPTDSNQDLECAHRKASTMNAMKHLPLQDLNRQSLHDIHPHRPPGCIGRLTLSTNETCTYGNRKRLKIYSTCQSSSCVGAISYLGGDMRELPWFGKNNHTSADVRYTCDTCILNRTATNIMSDRRTKLTWSST